MAKKSFNIGDYIQQAESKMDTMPRLIAVELHLIDPSPSNFYSMSGLDSLADNIATVGLLEPLRVREKDGRYVVVSGHRRRAALRILVDRGVMDPHDKIPVFLDDEPDTGEARDKDAARIALRQLRLIYANSDNRQYSSADKTREVQELTAIFSELKRLGYEFPGKIREHVAAAAHISDSRAARLAVIGKNLTMPRLREAYEAGRLGENAAYEIARHGADVIGRVDELPMGMVCEMTLERLGAVLEGLEKKAAEDAAEVKSYNDGVRAMESATPQSAGADSSPGQGSLTRSKFDAETYLAERAEEDASFREMLLGTADEFFECLTGVCDRQDGIAMLKKKLGALHAGWYHGGPCVYCSPKGVRLSGDGQEITRTWTAVYDMLCTIAFNSAKVDNGTEIGDGNEAPVSDMDMTEPRWMTGEPTRPGRYFCRVKLGTAMANEQRGYWDGGWTFYGMRLQEGWEVLSWWPLPEEV